MKKTIKIFSITLVFFIYKSFTLVFLLNFIPIYATPLVFFRFFEQISQNQEIQLKKEWVPLDNISKNVVSAVVSSEDQLFYVHNGFDWESISKAFEYNKKKKKIRGGSTISQQTAKNVFLWQGRSYIRKGLEAYFTVLIELIWSKNRIMEVYLNVIEMGNGVYGIEAASKYYYKKSAINLSRSEAASIAAILPNPRKYNPKGNTIYMNKRRSWILNQMKNNNF